MNCKPGDLALVVRAALPENVGKVVRCLEIAPAGTEHFDPDEGPVWHIDRKLPTIWGRLVPYAFDRRLMPIRPSEDHETSARVTAGEIEETVVTHRL